MTTLPSYAGMQDILGRLEGIRFRRWTLRLIASALAVVIVAMAAMLVVAVSLGYWTDQPPQWLRWLTLAAVCLALLATVGWFVVRAAIWKQNPAQTARFVEQCLPKMRNDLINAILLSGDRDQVSPELVQMAIREAAWRCRRVDLDESISLRSLKWWGIATAAVAVVLVGFAVLQPRALKQGLMGAGRLTGYVPRVNELKLTSLRPEDGATYFVGEEVTVIAMIENPAREAYRGEVIFKDGAAPVAMDPSNGYATFTAPLGPREQSFEFAVRIGGSRWPTDKPYFKVNVLKRVKILGLDVRYSYPPYTALKSKTVRNSDGRIEAPLGTLVTMTVRLGSPVKDVDLAIEGAAPLGMQPSQDRLSFSARMTVLQDGNYCIRIRDTRQQLPDPDAQHAADTFSSAGQSLMRGYYRIHAIPDEPPTIKFLRPTDDPKVAPGGKLATRLRMSDKYGLTEATFYAGKEGTEPKAVHQYAVKNEKKVERDYAFPLPDGLTEGDVVVCYATVTDNRNLPKIGGPQTTPSRRIRITVQDPVKSAAEKARRYEELMRRLLAILRMQETQRVNTGICWKERKTLPQIRTLGAEVVTGQKDIRAALAELAEKFDFDKETKTIQQEVAILANNAARLAIDQAQVVAELAAMDRREKACELLAGTQDKIIETLHWLLAHMATAGKKKQAKDATAPAGDLPPDVLEKLQQLDEDLQKFLEDQRKVIQATENLAKKPVDNFTAEDEELLKALATTEAKWEKFMNEAFSDLSKLVQQDFSNPALLKELMAVKSDITMAKDALKKKATEIATAAEDSAMGGGEEIISNIEKWLPDEPDRIKWAMEAPDDGQGNIEMPELPTELEDLVGDLLEQEEELFDEMEDVNSKAAMSGHDGIGWDAMDGPISNMGAQGVTGNQLPNTNELSGRSGEGRQGKSSGEFVEDKAVGKGGRRTPTRLTPEPFQKGQVNDTSTEPPGGATGGGKFSGAGEEGMEGPVPPEIKKEMPRLAQKQAAIVNKAERIRAQFKANDYANFKFLQAITLMNRVRRDLETYRYRNVLRAREKTLTALRQSKLRIGKIDVTEDASAGMPKYIRDDIADAMKGKLPEEFKDVLESYYRRLSESSQR